MPMLLGVITSLTAEIALKTYILTSSFLPVFKNAIHPLSHLHFSHQFCIQFSHLSFIWNSLYSKKTNTITPLSLMKQKFKIYSLPQVTLQVVKLGPDSTSQQTPCENRPHLHLPTSSLSPELSPPGPDLRLNECKPWLHHSSPTEQERYTFICISHVSETHI